MTRLARVVKGLGALVLLAVLVGRHPVGAVALRRLAPPTPRSQRRPGRPRPQPPRHPRPRPSSTPSPSSSGSPGPSSSSPSPSRSPPPSPDATPPASPSPGSSSRSPAGSSPPSSSPASPSPPGPATPRPAASDVRRTARRPPAGRRARRRPTPTLTARTDPVTAAARDDSRHSAARSHCAGQPAADAGPPTSSNEATPCGASPNASLVTRCAGRRSTSSTRAGPNPAGSRSPTPTGSTPAGPSSFPPAAAPSAPTPLGHRRRPPPPRAHRTRSDDRRAHRPPHADDADDHAVPAAPTHPASVPTAPRHRTSDRARRRTGAASLGFGGRRLVRRRGAGHRRHRPAPPPPRLPLPAARTGPGPHPRAAPPDARPSDSRQPRRHRSSRSHAAPDDAPVFPFDDDERRLEPGRLEIGTRDGATGHGRGHRAVRRGADRARRPTTSPGPCVAACWSGPAPAPPRFSSPRIWPSRLLRVCATTGHIRVVDEHRRRGPGGRGRAHRPHPSPGRGRASDADRLPGREPREPPPALLVLLDDLADESLGRWAALLADAPRLGIAVLFLDRQPR